MFIPFDFRVVRLGGLVTLRPAAMSGCRESARNPELNARIALFAAFSPYQTKQFAGIFLARVSEDKSS